MVLVHTVWMARMPSGRGTFLKDFTFVWVLMFLLVFYIVTVNLRSFVLFALGNVIVEVFLVYYIFKSRKN